MKVGFISLGCPKNLVDAEVMLGLAEQAGHEITAEAAEADVLVVNTCAFIDRARQESVDTILEMAELKKVAPHRRLVVTGCLAERYREELAREIPEIDAVLGTGEVPRIVEALTGATAGASPLAFYRRDPAQRAPEVRVPASAGGESPSEAAGRVPARDEGASPSVSPVFGLDLPTYLYDAETPRRQTTPGHYAYVKVAEGCDYACAFCVIPQMRGHYRSRPIESIVREARALAGRGVRELLLISQDTTFYGVDRRERGALPRLLRALDRVGGIEWIRLLYLYPTTITDETIATIAEAEKVCKYIDLPLQHASDAVLKRMKRPGTRRSYEALLRGIRDRMPGVSLRTTFITGFPGETDADVDALVDFIQGVEFDHVGVFTYSHEEGTSAFELPDDVPAPVKAERRRRVMAVQKRIVTRRQRARVGERVRLMVDGPSPEHELAYQGRLATQAPDIDPVVYLTDCDPELLAPGHLIEARIVGARDYDLVARVLA
jgi:ribosomal protein S12 methylthiotransferase